MKKFVTMLSESAKELRSTRNLTLCAMFAAIAVVLGYFTIQISSFLKIGFSGIPNQIVSCLFGPAAGAMFGGALDIIKYIIAYRCILSGIYNQCNSGRTYIRFILL